MRCDYCKTIINSNEGTNVFLIRIHGALEWFCCEECRLKFMQEHFINTQINDKGHFDL
jgi:hypothetical protein